MPAASLNSAVAATAPARSPPGSDAAAARLGNRGCRVEALRLADIVKVTSGSTPEVAAQVDALYRQVVQAAGSKWNFLNFRPGLVGGHCIGVDPYYLTHKAESLGYHPEILLAGRRLNDGMGAYVAGEMVKAMLRRGLPVAGARVLVMGLTFKENCPDLRNTRVIDVLRALEEFGVLPEVHDPHADPEEALREYGISLVTEPAAGRYDGVMLAVAHDTFRQMGAEAIRAYGTPGALLYDLKYILPPEASDLRL